MSLSEKLADDLKSAMKSGDRAKVSVIRMVKSAVKNREIEKGSPLSDDEITAVIHSISKQVKDSIEQFSKGGRQDLVQKESEELAIIQSYLPQQLSPDEVKTEVEKVIREINATSVKDMGRVMKEVMSRLKGRADGKLINQFVKDVLGG